MPLCPSGGTEVACNKTPGARKSGPCRKTANPVGRTKMVALMKFSRGRTLAEAFAAVNNHGPGFDTLRLLAASAVMYHHASILDHDIVHDGLFRFSQGYTQLGLFAVSIFFALSGYLVAPGLVKSGDVIGYLSRRFMRIMPLLCVVVVLCAFVVGPALTSLPLADYFASPLTWKYLKNVTTALSLGLPGIVNHAGTNDLNGPMWTLRWEWLCYFALAAASLASILRRRLVFLVIYIALQVLVLSYYGFIPADQPMPYAYLLLFLFGYFGAGTLMFLFRDVIPCSGIAIAAVAVLFAIVMTTGLGYALAPICAAYLVTCFGLFRFPWSGLLAKADLSFGIYLTHSVILTILVNMHPFQSGIALFAACLPIACVVAWISWTTIERPALRHKDLPAQLARRMLQGVRNIGSPSAAR